MKKISWSLHFIFRAACAMCFIGHGMFGVITKQVWCNYFAVFGIDETTSYMLMPYVGSVDIILGLSILFYPVTATVTWLVLWALLTALLRPLSGESFAEFLERAGNYGVPAVWLMLTGIPSLKDWFKKIPADGTVSNLQLASITRALQIFGFLLLAGHGWLNLTGKETLLQQYSMLGFQNPGYVAHLIGLFEIIASILLLAKPDSRIVMIILLWKMTSEIFYPAYGVVEWIERGGSYAVLLALWLIMRQGSHYSFFINTWRQKNPGVGSC